MNHEPRAMNHTSETGVTYISLLLAIVLIGIATAALTPMWSTMVQREKEAELLFRLGEFRRAIARYRQPRTERQSLRLGVGRCT